jgi:HPt (histidine-containing phosphotransfer) domain-containing protein
MTDEADDKDPEWLALQRRYLETATESVAALAAWVRGEPSAFGTADEAYRAMHNLAGMAAAYGFPALGEAARKVEDGLKDGARETLTGRVADLEQALADDGLGDFRP